MNSTPSSNNMAVVRAAATHGSSLANSGVAGVLTLARAAAKFKGQGKVEVATASKSLSYDEVEILTGVLKMRQLVVSSPTVLTPLDECFMLSMDDVVCADFLRRLGHAATPYQQRPCCAAGSGDHAQDCRQHAQPNPGALRQRSVADCRDSAQQVAHHAFPSRRGACANAAPHQPSLG